MKSEMLTACLPQLETLIEEKRLFKNSVLTKIQSHLKQQSQLPPFLEENIANQWKLAEVAPSLVFLSYSLKNQNVPLEGLVDSLKEKFESPFSFCLPPYPEWVENVIKLQNNSLERGSEDETLIQKFNKDTEVQCKAFKTAFHFLKEHWPEGAFCVESLIKCIILVDSESFWSSSIPIYQGAIIVAPQMSWNLAHYIETLVHESAHLELNIRRMLDPLITNSKEIAYSSLRKSNRPLLGILHAAFVLIRTTRALDLLQPHHLGEEFTSCTDMKRDFSTNLRDSLHVLKTAAQFTPLGAQLFQNMCLQAKEALA